MVKRKLPEKVIKAVQKYIAILKTGNLPISAVYVFGSYAKGKEHEDSDVDVAVISPQFKNSWEALQYLWRNRPQDLGMSIEPVGFSPEDFKSKYSSLINEIKTYGVAV